MREKIKKKLTKILTKSGLCFKEERVKTQEKEMRDIETCKSPYHVPDISEIDYKMDISEIDYKMDISEIDYKMDISEIDYKMDISEIDYKIVGKYKVNELDWKNIKIKRGKLRSGGIKELP